MSSGTGREVTQAERRARLAVRHRLVPAQRTDDVAAIADALVCIHSSDPASVVLSIAARMVEPTIDAIETALYRHRSLLRYHAMRRTLWVSTLPVARDAYGSSAPKIAETERRKLAEMLDHSVDDPDRWIEEAKTIVLATLDELGEASTRQVGLHAPGVRLPIELAPGRSYGATQFAHARVLLLLAFEGAIVRTQPTGSWANGQYPWMRMERWVPGGIAGEDRTVAAARLADRWLRSFGPAPASDLQWWTGWNRGDVDRALRGCGAVECMIDGEPAWLAADDESTSPDVPSWVALLPGLDATTMGWKGRNWYLDRRHQATLFDRNGNAGPTIWANGRVVGGWVQHADGTIVTELLDDVDRAERTAIGERAEMMAQLIGDVRFKVRFPTPSSKRLHA